MFSKEKDSNHKHCSEKGLAGPHRHGVKGSEYELCSSLSAQGTVFHCLILPAGCVPPHPCPFLFFPFNKNSLGPGEMAQDECVGGIAGEVEGCPSSLVLLDTEVS